MIRGGCESNRPARVELEEMELTSRGCLWWYEAAFGVIEDNGICKVGLEELKRPGDILLPRKLQLQEM